MANQKVLKKHTKEENMLKFIIYMKKFPILMARKKVLEESTTKVENLNGNILIKMERMMAQQLGIMKMDASNKKFSTNQELKSG